MRILTLDQLQDTTADVAFVPSRMTPLLFCIFFLPLFLIDGAFVAGIIPRGRVPVLVTVGLIPVLFAGAAMGCLLLYATVRSDFWLCRIRGDTMWIRCSNESSAPIIELDRSELAWAQPLRITYKSKWGARRSSVEYEWHRYLELGLNESAAELLDAFVKDERIPKNVREQNIAPEATVINMPARMIHKGVLRLYWSGISPGLKQAGNILAEWTEVRPFRRETQTND